MTLNYTSAVLLAAFSVAVALIAGRRTPWEMVAAVAAGFAGVLPVPQPSFESFDSNATFAGLASVVMAALAFLHVKELGQLSEPECRIVFYFAAMGVALGPIGVLATGFSAHTAASR